MIFSPIKCWPMLVAALVLAGCTSGGGSDSSQSDEGEGLVESLIDGLIGTPSEQATAAPNSPVLVTELGNESLTIAQQDLVWAACDTSNGVECATLVVPLDYANPEAQTIEIEIARIQRDDRSNIQRTLLINPGGPGGSGINYLTTFANNARISSELQEQIDFVSFDPRGIGRSSAIECDLTSLFQMDIYPVSREEIAANLDLANQFTDQCVDQHGDVLQHLGSNNVVLDVDEMRKALGLGQIDFLGFSYGSRLAALYMQNFPTRAGRFVMDASVSPSPSVATLVQGGLLPGQINIDNLASACVGITIVCDPDEFAAALQQRMDELGAQPASAEIALLVSILELAMTRPGFEQLLIGRLAEYVKTNNVAELEFLDMTLGLGEQAEGASLRNTTVNIAVLCADDAARPTIDSLIALNDQFNSDSNLLAEIFISNVGLCATWPAALNPVDTIATNQAPVSLVIGGATDAITPRVFAESMAEAVGGQFLLSEHTGHTTVFTGINACTDAAVDTFLLTGELPSSSTCEAGGATFVADWHTEHMR